MTLTSNITAVRKISVVQAEVEGCWCWHLFTGRQGTGKRLELGRGAHSPKSLNVKSVFMVECTKTRSFFQEAIMSSSEIGLGRRTSAQRAFASSTIKAATTRTLPPPATTSATTTTTTTPSTTTTTTTTPAANITTTTTTTTRTTTTTTTTSTTTTITSTTTTTTSTTTTPSTTTTTSTTT